MSVSKTQLVCKTERAFLPENLTNTNGWFWIRPNWKHLLITNAVKITSVFERLVNMLETNCWRLVFVSQHFQKPSVSRLLKYRIVDKGLPC